MVRHLPRFQVHALRQELAPGHQGRLDHRPSVARYYKTKKILKHPLRRRSHIGFSFLWFVRCERSGTNLEQLNSVLQILAVPPLCGKISVGIGDVETRAITR